MSDRNNRQFAVLSVTGYFLSSLAAAGIIFMAKATSNANNIPDTVPPPAAP